MSNVTYSGALFYILLWCIISIAVGFAWGAWRAPNPDDRGLNIFLVVVFVAIALTMSKCGGV